MKRPKVKTERNSKKHGRQDFVLKTNIDYGDRSFEEPTDEALVLSGEMGVGKGGNPVTISVMDELTGEEMEINHVTNALLILEDRRRSSNGWLSVLIGDLDKIGAIFRLLAKTTLEELRRIVNPK